MYKAWPVPNSEFRKYLYFSRFIGGEGEVGLSRKRDILQRNEEYSLPAGGCGVPSVSATTVSRTIIFISTKTIRYLPLQNKRTVGFQRKTPRNTVRHSLFQSGMIGASPSPGSRVAIYGKGGAMRTVTVYHVDYLRKTRIPIGSVVERRKKERGNNYLGLLRLARKVYASSPEEAFAG
jgi:hypothetical protein